MVTVLRMDSRATLQCNVFPYVYAVYWLPPASFKSVFIGQKMQLTGRNNANNMRNAACADTRTSIEWRDCSFPTLW